MNSKWQGVKIAVLLSVAIGWWGLWYPELATEADTYAIVWEDGTVQSASEVIECELNGYSYMDLMEADNSQLQFRSKLWMKLEEYLKKVRSES